MSETGTLTLAGFLLERIADREAAARAAIKQSGASWGVDANEDDGVAVVTTAEEFRDAYRGNRGLLWDWEDGYIGAAPESAAHIALNDPAYVLAECEAKRRRVADFEELNRDYKVARTDSLWARRFQATVAMAHDAAVYADHPDYRPEWRP